ncbi:MAG TPA: sigma-54 dependent transcriptional regulator [Burkholderiales bacterium]|nr:sigma-54 dependent transcriptional regulator [Burkholderiales bacterium]
MSERILIVDDDPVQRRLLDNMVRRFGYDARLADGGEAAMAALSEQAGAQIHAVVLDLVMPNLDGLGVLAKMRGAGLNIPVVVQTAHGGIDNVGTAMRAGAADFVVKPVIPERLQVSLRNAIAASALRQEFVRVKRSRAGTLGLRDVIGKSGCMQHVLRLGQRAADSNIPILIEGEPGAGKEFIARAIHGSSARKPVKIDVRLICATSRDIIAEVKTGRFREDLFYRLHGLPISVPPLRDRREDIAELARFFLARFAAEEGKRVVRLSAGALQLLCGYQWPGNVRELEHAVFRAVVLCEADAITAADFPQIAAQASATSDSIRHEEPLATSLAPTEAANADLDVMALPGLAAASAPATLDLLDSVGNVRPLEELETEAIRYAIAHYRGQMSEVARRLRIGRSTLYRKLDVLGIQS